MITAKLESPSAEQLVLASIIENNGLHDDIGGLLGADDFWCLRHCCRYREA